MSEQIRINKYIAEQGWASRREADTLIKKGGIFVNGKKAVIGQKIEENDFVELKGATKEKKYLAYYKGRGIITHSPDIEKGEVDIIKKITSNSKGCYPLLDEVSPVGRLDKDSEGLIILSNDGRITGPLLDPKAHQEKVYEVAVDKNVTGLFMSKLENGVNIEGYVTKSAKATRHPKSTRKFTLTLTEGKKHQIRRMCAALGYQVQDLKRVQIMNIKLGSLKPNQYRKIVDKELREFLKKLNIE